MFHERADTAFPGSGQSRKSHEKAMKAEMATDQPQQALVFAIFRVKPPIPAAQNNKRSVATAPDGDQRCGPLELPRRFPDQERFIRLPQQGEERSEYGLQPIECGSWWPVFRRSEFLQPRAGRGEDQLAAGPNQLRHAI